MTNVRMLMLMIIMVETVALLASSSFLPIVGERAERSYPLRVLSYGVAAASMMCVMYSMVQIGYSNGVVILFTGAVSLSIFVYFIIFTAKFIYAVKNKRKSGYCEMVVESCELKRNQSLFGRDTYVLSANNNGKTISFNISKSLFDSLKKSTEQQLRLKYISGTNVLISVSKIFN